MHSRTRPGGQRSTNSKLAARGALICFASGALSTALPATTYEIASLSDGVAVDGECRLREAIRAAHTDLAVNECPAGGAEDTIVLATAGIYRYDQGEEVVQFAALTVRGGTESPADHVIDMGDQNRFLVWTGASGLLLENLTLRNGNAFGSGGEDGGALRIVAGAFALRGVVIENSRAMTGGGVSVLLGDGFISHATFDRVQFLGNTATGSSTSRGGGLDLLVSESGEVEMRESLFEGNRSESTDPGAQVQGGGMNLIVFPGPISIEISRSVFRANSALAPAGGRGGAICLASSAGSSTLIRDASFEGNDVSGVSTSDLGEAVDAEISGDANLVMRRLQVVGEVASGSIEALLKLSAYQASSVLLESSLVATGGNVGLFARADDSAALVVSQSTVAGNVAGGVEARGFSTVPLRIEGSILWGNGTVANDLVVAGSVDADRVANHNWIGDQGDPDPLFVDGPNGDFRLLEVSDAIDAGDAAFASVGPYDLDHAPRVAGPEIDLGAFEQGGIFADGFESGSMAAWSSATTAPVSPLALERSVPALKGERITDD